MSTSHQLTRGGGMVVLLITLALLSAACSVTPAEIGQATQADNSSQAGEENVQPAGGENVQQPAGEDVQPSSDVSRFELVEGELPMSTDRLIGFIDFVEQETGRAFLRPPRIAVQNLEDFNEGLEPDPDDIAEARETAEVDARYLQAIGHTTLGAQELFDLVIDVLTSSDLIAGYFDPEVDTLFVPSGETVDAQFESTLVHELVHALDHQHVNLQAQLDLADEAIKNRIEGRFAIFSVAEGRASAVQGVWENENDTPPPEDTDLGILEDLPASVLLDIALPYEIGEQLILQLGGPDDTWYLYSEPLASSEQVFFPAKIGNDDPVSVPTPPADGEQLDAGVLGADSVLLWLIGDSLEPEPSTTIAAFGAIEGWAGGSWVLWGDSDRSCLRAHIWGDTESDRDRLTESFEAWADDSADRGVDADVSVTGDTLQVTACAPFAP